MADATAVNPEESLLVHRAHTFERLGFSCDQAKLLAHAKDKVGFKLSHHEVNVYMTQGEQKGIKKEKMIELIMRIFSPEVE